MRRGGEVPEPTVQPGESPQTVRDLRSGHRPRRVPGIGTSARQIFHHDDVVEAGPVDDHVVRTRVVDGERHARAVEVGLVEEVPVARVDLAVRLRLGLDEHRLGTGTGRVLQTEPRPPVGAVVGEEQGDLAHLRTGMCVLHRGRHPLRRDVFPCGRDAGAVHDHVLGRLVSRAAACGTTPAPTPRSRAGATARR